MSSEKRTGDKASPSKTAQQDEEAFARCRGRLERAVSASCEAEQQWAARVAAGIYAALEFAAGDPAAARLLTAHSTIRRFGSRVAFEEMVGHFAGLLYVDAPTPKRQPSAEPGDVVERIASQVSHQLEHARADQMLEIAPDLIVYVLTSRVGYEEAKSFSNGRPF